MASLSICNDIVVCNSHVCFHSLITLEILKFTLPQYCNRSGSYVWIPNCMNECGCVTKLSPTLRSVPRGIGTLSCHAVVRQGVAILSRN